MESRFASPHPIADDTTRDQIRSARGAVNYHKMETNVGQMIFFASWLKDLTAPLWSSVLTKFVSPAFAIVGSVFSSIYAWKEFHKSRQKHALAAAIVETAAGAAMIVAAIGIMASIAALSFVAPMLFVAAIGLKTLFSLGSSLYFVFEARRARAEGNEEARTVNLHKAKHAALEGLTGAVVTAAAVVLMLFAAPLVQTIVLSIAVAATAAALIHGLVKMLTSIDKNTRAESAAMQADNDYNRDSSLLIAKRLGHGHDNVSPLNQLESQPGTDHAGTSDSYVVQPQAYQPLQGHSEQVSDHSYVALATYGK